MEEWRWVPGYEGFYEVSDLGHVRSYLTRNRHVGGATTRGEPKLRVPGRHKHGYPLYTLCVKQKKVCFPAHVLVCMAWHGPKPSPKHEVRHLDGNPQNNAPANLAWGTKSENSHDAILHGTHGGLKTKGERNGHAKLTSEQVAVIRHRAVSGETHKTIATDFHIHPCQVSRICSGKRW